MRWNGISIGLVGLGGVGSRDEWVVKAMDLTTFTEGRWRFDCVRFLAKPPASEDTRVYAIYGMATHNRLARFSPFLGPAQ